MKTLCFSLSLFFISILSNASPPKVLSLPHKQVTLKNGFRVTLVKYPSPGVIAYQFPVHAGSRNEIEKGKSGFAHFFEHLMFRGTKKRSAKEFGDLYVKLGCENNAWTSSDMTNYHGVVSKAYFSQILEAESDRFKNLFFDEKALRDEAGAVLGEYNKNVAQPEFQLEEKLNETAFKLHPYSHTTMGYRSDIVQYGERYKDVWPFFKRYYTPSNVSLVVVGDVDFNQTLSEIKKYFESWKNSSFPAVEIPKEPLQDKSRSAEVKLDKPTQTRIAMAYKIPAFTTKTLDSAALALVSEIYFSVTSNFQKKYRFDKKWVDHVSAGGVETLDPGLFTVFVRLSEKGKSKEKDIAEAVTDVLQQIADDSNLEQKLKTAKLRFANDVAVSWFDSAESLAGRIAWYTNFEKDIEVLDRVVQNFEKVDSTFLKQTAKKYFVDSSKTVVFVRGN